MNALRIGILAAAAVAAVAVAFFVRQAMTVEEPQVAQIVQIEQRPAPRILAARRDINVGERVSASDFYWQSWPEEAVSAGYIVENRGQDASDFAGAVVRAAIRQGEPVTGRRLVQQGDAGFMSAVLAPGMRAVAVPTSAVTGAGGFILPNDRVDVIVSFQRQNEETSRREYVARTIVENARVLAIDQTYADEEGEGTVVGETATLELTAAQARAVSLAVAQGEVTLVLRALEDTTTGPSLVSVGDSLAAAPVSNDDDSVRRVTLIRYGRAQTLALAGDE
ncbi:MAG: Flp pilus assembly protein CpaB [Maricaulis sp.]|uniref:Flp pilus assembly protein CpaB n=1 Tax=Maricaulis sp. TaxID=1486257 RepID=UPI001B214B23|nr:Flp pilus assembly protein CpaB [Maricaulis sp.]MBO6730636.1 Flp pilus assembly protein CpaB [Maricaulis sp.]MBO6845892.1 Flp pilus assembly protein CpaB [Maricaulis sp.]MBO6878705.1 Flp pilus assembly protein CpaB [Maricaulis sp.]